MKTYDIQDKMDALYSLLDEVQEDVNTLLTENEQLKTTNTKLKKVIAYREIEHTVKTKEEQMYLDYIKEFYGKELT